MLVLVINSGSSSVKFRLLEMVEEGNGVLATRPALLEGAVKDIGGDRNRAAVGLALGCAAKISTDESRLAAYVVAADEETWIARETVRCLRGRCS